MTIDKFQHTPPSPSGPATRHHLVTPSDSELLPFPAAALWVEQGGAIAVRALEGDNTIVYTMPDYSILPVRTNQILATGTTATRIVAWG